VERTLDWKKVKPVLLGQVVLVMVNTVFFEKN
jgi:hypothetical protein